MADRVKYDIPMTDPSFRNEKSEWLEIRIAMELTILNRYLKEKRSTTSMEMLLQKTSFLNAPFDLSIRSAPRNDTSPMITISNDNLITFIDDMQK
jgi:hypothetical protein